MTTQVQTFPRLPPRAVYWLDTAVCLVLGVVIAATAGPLNALLGWPLPATLLLVAGLVLIPWSAFNLWTARAARVGPATLGVHLVVDFGWAAGSVALALAYASAMTPIGLVMVLGQAAAVAGVGLIKLIAARALRA